MDLLTMPAERKSSARTSCAITGKVDRAIPPGPLEEAIAKKADKAGIFRDLDVNMGADVESRGLFLVDENPTCAPFGSILRFRHLPMTPIH